ncbi:MAG: aminotransferase class I and II [Caldilineaceae bacterium]|nr:hypothetical protein [Caldilineaceae bacterium]MCB9139208.1 aminotransferase class I and II [Caldilineaceae bacterium]
MSDQTSLPHLRAVRYVVPLREGGSLPAVVEADDGQLYVMKFHGAGQGVKALIAEVISGRIGQALGLSVPELVLLEMGTELGRSEPNPEIRELLRASTGLNFGMRYLPGALAYTPMAPPLPDARLASSIVWFDAYITNVDRTARNVNMLIAQGRHWLIDHGASLIFHHGWDDYMARSTTPFPFIRQHVLLPLATDLSGVDGALRARLTDDVLAAIAADVPDAWLKDEDQFASPAEVRNAYAAYLRARRDGADAFVEEARHAHEQL